MTELIDGKALAQKMQQELAAKVNNLKQKKRHCTRLSRYSCR